MTPEQKQQILDNAPEGATHWHKVFDQYFNGARGCYYFESAKNEWCRTNSDERLHLISLESLREPATGKPEMSEREKIMFEALEVISEEPHINADIRSVLKGSIVVARTALKRAYSLPNENWSEADEARMDVIGSNGATGDHYSNEQTAADFLQAGLKHMQDRAATYDKPEGERSMAATVQAFSAITGISMTEEQGWLFMVLLKAVRSQQGQYRADCYEDGAAYFALAGEAASQERQ